jgi:predicted dehydrogenase
LTNQVPINFIVIGGGRMGQTHIQAGKECGFNLVGVCDIRGETLRELQDKFSLIEDEIFTNYEYLLKKNNFDLAIIATTAPSHYEIVMALTKTNTKYILCEKPLTTNLKKANSMVSECKKTGKVLSVNHQMRFMENFQIVKKYQRSDEFGSLRSILISGANIGLAMNATHYFEAFRYLTDSKLSRVWAWLDKELKPNPRGPEFFDQSGQMLAKNDSGQRIFLDIGSDIGHQIICTYNFEYGKITINELNGIATINSREKPDKTISTGMYGQKDDEQIISLKPAETLAPTVALLRSVIKMENYPSGEDGIHSISVALAAIESGANNNKLVNISDLQTSDLDQKWA